MRDTSRISRSLVMRLTRPWVKAPQPPPDPGAERPAARHDDQAAAGRRSRRCEIRTREGCPPLPPGLGAGSAQVSHDGPRPGMPTTDCAATLRRESPGSKTASSAWSKPCRKAHNPSACPGQPHDKNPRLGPCPRRPCRMTRSARSDTDHEENFHPHLAAVGTRAMGHWGRGLPRDRGARRLCNGTRLDSTLGYRSPPNSKRPPRHGATSGK